MRTIALDHGDYLITAFCPTREDVETLQVGDLAPDCFGGMSEVTEICYRVVNPQGRLVVGYYAKTKEGMTHSMSLEESRIVRSLQVCKAFTSAEIDQLEKRVNQ